MVCQDDKNIIIIHTSPSVNIVWDTTTNLEPYILLLTWKKITFKVVQMKFLAMHITNQKKSSMEHDLYLIS